MVMTLTYLIRKKSCARQYDCPSSSCAKCIDEKFKATTLHRQDIRARFDRILNSAKKTNEAKTRTYLSESSLFGAIALNTQVNMVEPRVQS